MNQEADAVVVGCGIAGGLIAHRLARDGFKVIALEKRPVVGVPVRCGEATGNREEIARFIPVDEAWIAGDINGARLHAPNGDVVEKRLPGIGVMLNRELFDQALARQAEDSGAVVRTHNEATGLLQKGAVVTGVAVRNHDTGARYTIESRVVIGADGVEGFVGRWAGITTHLRPRQIHSAIEYVLDGAGFPTDTIELFVGRKVSPGGYAWVFPKGGQAANVGLGVHPTMAREGTAREYLDKFVAAHFPAAEVRRVVAGGVSGTKPLRTMVTHGALLVGEAAHQNNPFSGGGIMNALEGAEEAHKVLAVALRGGDLSKESLKRYDDAWHDREGRNIAKFALLRELFFKLDDGDIDNLVAVLKTMVSRAGGRIDYAEFFRAAFRAVPGVLWKARRILW